MENLSDNHALEPQLQSLQASLQRLMGLHRQLLDIVRAEKETIREAQLPKIQEAIYAKEGLIESIRVSDLERQKILVRIALALKKPIKELSLSQLAIDIQGKHPKQADALRSAQNALVILVQRIQEQNAYNRGLIESSLEHVRHMKKNILGESVPRSDTYSQQGQKVPGGAGGSRLISKEV